MKNEELPADGVQGNTFTVAFPSDWAVMLVHERQAPGSGWGDFLKRVKVQLGGGKQDVDARTFLQEIRLAPFANLDKTKTNLPLILVAMQCSEVLEEVTTCFWCQMHE